MDLHGGSLTGRAVRIRASGNHIHIAVGSFLIALTACSGQPSNPAPHPAPVDWDHDAREAIAEAHRAADWYDMYKKDNKFLVGIETAGEHAGKARAIMNRTDRGRLSAQARADFDQTVKQLDTLEVKLAPLLKRARVANERARKADRAALDALQSSTFDDLHLLSSRWIKGGFGAVALWAVTVRNTSKTVRFIDLTYRTEYSGASGTSLDSHSGVIYDFVNPGQTRTFQVNDGLIQSQVAGATFQLTGGKPAVRKDGAWLTYK